MEAVCDRLSAARFTCWRQKVGKPSTPRLQELLSSPLPLSFSYSQLLCWVYHQQQRGSSQRARPPTCNLHTAGIEPRSFWLRVYKKEKVLQEEERKMRKADSFMLVCGGLGAGDDFVRTNVSKHLERPLPLRPKRPPTAGFCRVAINLVPISRT